MICFSLIWSSCVHIDKIWEDQLTGAVFDSGEFASSPVTLGGCEHIFCNTCCEDYLGSSCPVCSLRADVKDADVDRQLFSLASLCAKLKQELLVDGKIQDDYKENEDPQIQCTPNQPIPGASSYVGTVVEGGHVIDHSINRPDRKQIRSTQNKVVPPVNKKKSVRKAKRQDNVKETKEVSVSPVVRKSENMSKSAEKNNGKRAATSVTSPVCRSPRKRRKSLPVDQTTMTQFFDACDENDTDIVIVEADKDIGGKSRNKKSLRNENVTEKTPRSAEKSKTKSKTRLRHSLDSNIGKNLPGTPDKVTTTGKGKTKGKDLPGTPDKVTTPGKGKPKGGKEKVSKVTGQVVNDVFNTSVCDTDLGTHTPMSEKSRSRLKDVSTPVAGIKKAESTPKGRQLRQPPKSTQSPALNKRNAKGETPLQVAAIKNDIEKVKQLLGEGANPNIRDNAGWTPLHEACNHGYLEVAGLLLDHGAMINIPGLENDTPLHDAIDNGRVECVKLLVSKGASFTLRNMHGQTAKDLAVTDVMKKALKTPVVTSVDTGTTEPVDLMEYQAPCLLGTGLSREAKVTLQKAASQLQVKLADEVTPEVTHIVTKFNSEGMCPRTIKLVHGILLGKWILNMEWLETCTQVGSMVCEEAFEAQGTSLFPQAQAPSKGRINRKHQLPGLFDGCYFYFHGSFEYANPTKDDLIKIISAGGGKLLSREPKPGHLEITKTVPYHADCNGELATCCVFLVHESTVKFKTIRTKYMCSTPASWLMDCVANFKLLPLPSS